ncbi:DcaP family trimeric outer membrane transporter [Microbulbifer rhizosphaerae]|uniref:Porin n=1 Tax=Microbulbifer rhizosphaerae TaxID=1562603 RepID=A0A7W4Z919_9GAMM|nr:DcaP family trimeric outer membrane transporter [Microbulbifer rhizosphaerae]MBB3061167.1 hypothetical protein [Microbulbifer rhizosphaerae]
MSSRESNTIVFRLSTGVLALSAMIPLAAVAQATNEELQLRIEELQAQVSQLAEEAKRREMVDNPEPEQPQEGTQIEFGGFIKLDSQFSDYSDGSSATAGIGEDFLVPSTIPVGGEDGDTKYHSHAKSSRLFIKSHTALARGHVNTHLEVDAMASGQGDERISNSYSQRLRHAYVDWHIDENRSLLAGQTWSTFFNVGALPEGMDFVGPVGTIFERQPQLRYTHKIGGGSIQVSAENPATTLYNGTENPYDDNGMPDIVLRYNNSIGDFSYSVASMSRELAYEDGAAAESVRGYAVSVSGKYQVGRDDIRFMLSSGNALGRYMGLNGFRSGIIEGDGDIELIDQSGGFIALRHFWSDQLRTNLVLSASTADNPDAVSDTTASDYRSMHLNLLYSPVPKITLGGEYILANKEVENVSGILADDKGELRRLQFSVKYVF